MGDEQNGGIVLSRGLLDQDDNIDTLSELFEKMQLVTVDIADPSLDLITFAQSAHYFAVILERPGKPSSTPENQDEPKVEPENKPTLTTHLMPRQRQNKRKRETQNQQRAQGEDGGSDAGRSRAHAQESDETLVNPPPPPPPPSPSPSPSTSTSAFTDESENSWGDDANQIDPPHWRNHSPKAIGLVYLTASPNFWDPLHVGELNIGIILQPKFRGKGYAQEVVLRVASIAFDEGHCHRLQAILLDRVVMNQALSLFTKMNFAHEGTRRRSFFSPMEQEWKDVTYMALLDTDWVMRNSRGFRSAPKSIWDALFARHQQEREELLRWEAKTSLKRTSSMVTIMGPGAALAAIPPVPTPSSSDVESDGPTDLVMKGKRKVDSLENPSDLPHEDGHLSVKRWVELTSSELFLDDVLSDRSATPDSSTSSTSSMSWDDIETDTAGSLPSRASSRSSLFEFVDE